METRSNWLLVSLLVGALISAVIGFSAWLWLGRHAGGPTYETRFEQSVLGLQKGSNVNMLGVPVGRVTELRLEPANPRLVIVRFALASNVKLRLGVTASIERSLFDGSATIRLEGGSNRAPELVARAGHPFPVVPVKGGGLLGGNLGPANMVARVSSAVESISNNLDPAGQRQIEARLAELARRSRSGESNVDRVAGQIGQTGRMKDFGRAMARAGDGAARLRRRLEGSRGGIGENLARRLRDAERTAESAGESISRARPRIRRLDDDAQRITETVHSLREPVRRVGDAVRKIDREGLRSTKLPDYDAPKDRR